MREELEIIRSNIEGSLLSLNISKAVFIGQIEELTALLLNKKLSFDEAFEIFSNIFGLSALSAEFLLFCKKLSDNNLFENYSSVEHKDKTPTVAFLSNEYSNEAFDRLFFENKAIGDNEFSFNAALEAVYSGRCDYALIPLYNTTDGLIISIYRLIAKYELKIAASVRVVMADGMTETEFCLVSKNEQYADAPNRAIISITHSLGYVLGDFLNSFSLSNIKALSVNTLPLGYTDERCESVIMLDITDFDINALKCFISNGIPDANCIGIYNLK